MKSGLRCWAMKLILGKCQIFFTVIYNCSVYRGRLRKGNSLSSSSNSLRPPRRLLRLRRCRSSLHEGQNWEAFYTMFTQTLISLVAPYLFVFWSYTGIRVWLFFSSFLEGGRGEGLVANDPRIDRERGFWSFVGRPVCVNHLTFWLVTFSNPIGRRNVTAKWQLSSEKDKQPFMYICSALWGK